MIRSPDQRPLFEPPSTWQPYVGPLPRLQGLMVAIDTETRDDGLAQKRGPGWFNNNGWLAGVSVAWEDQQIYLPVRHPSTECRDLGEVVSWTEDVLRSNTVVFHNMGYDMGWLRQSGVRVWPERAHDTYIMSVMLDENWDDYDLDECCRRAGVEGKDESALRNAANAYGVDPKSGLWRLPARHVGPYAEQDARATLNLAQVLLPQIERDRMEDAYRTEMQLVEVLYDMKRRGIRINLDRAEEFQREMRARREGHLAEIGRLAGRKMTMTDLNSADRLAPVLDKLEIDYGRTRTGKASVTRQFLERLDHPVGALIRSARQTNDMAEKFVGTYLLEFSHMGRVHADVHQLRDSEGGTRSHRLSYSNPPLQQAPSRDDELGPMFRRIMEPESGEYWAAPDFASQEPRMTVHYAAAIKAHGHEDMVRYFREDPKPDLHSWTAGLIGWSRKRAKDVYQGLAYGMGVPKLGRVLGIPEEEAAEVMEMFHGRVPWLRALSDYCSRMAMQRGWIRLIDGARCHFDHWQPVGRRVERPLRESEAEETWPGARLERVWGHKAMNRLAQGSSARQMKRAMVECHRQKIPLLVQMHDELGLSTPDERRGQMVSDIMVEACPLVIPVRVDLEFGRTWGDAKYSWENRDK